MEGSLGRCRKITKEDAETLFEALIRSGWMYQDEIRATNLCKPVNYKSVKKKKKKKWSHHVLKAISINRSEELRERYRNGMRLFAAEYLVFLDESIFIEKTGWRGTTPTLLLAMSLDITQKSREVIPRQLYLHTRLMVISLAQDSNKVTTIERSFDTS